MPMIVSKFIIGPIAPEPIRSEYSCDQCSGSSGFVDPIRAQKFADNIVCVAIMDAQDQRGGSNKRRSQSRAEPQTCCNFANASVTRLRRLEKLYCQTEAASPFTQQP
jgi:hypothetical protein